MKKYIIAAAFSALALAATAGAQNHSFSSDLFVGSSGPDVVSLQSWLISNGYPIPAISAGGARGYFGAQTKSALIGYQTAAGLPANGFFGPLTRAKINGGTAVIVPPNPGVSVTLIS